MGILPGVDHTDTLSHYPNPNPTPDADPNPNLNPDPNPGPFSKLTTILATYQYPKWLT